MFCIKQNHKNKGGIMLKLNKLLHGLVQMLLSWYNHLQKGLNELDFKILKLNHGMHYGQGVILITHLKDTLFFGPNLEAIKKVIIELRNLGYGWTRQEGNKASTFAYLGVSILPNPVTMPDSYTQGSSALIRSTLRCFFFTRSCDNFPN
jgi:hypothetical protein